MHNYLLVIAIHRIFIKTKFQTNIIFNEIFHFLNDSTIKISISIQALSNIICIDVGTTYIY